MGRSHILAPSPRKMYTVGKDVAPKANPAEEDWDGGDFGHRDHEGDPLGDIETGEHLRALDQLPGLIRMMMESTEWHVQLDDKGRITKVIRCREEEKLQGFDPDEPSEDQPEINPEDALAPGRWDQLSAVTSEEGETEGEYTVAEEEEGIETATQFQGQRPQARWTPPKRKWDLVFVNQECNTRCREPGNKCPIHVKFSAPIFPQITYHKYSKAFHAAEYLIRFSPVLLGPKVLYEIGSNVTPQERKRLWQLWRIEKWLRDNKDKEAYANAAE